MTKCLHCVMLDDYTLMLSDVTMLRVDIYRDRVA